jgi:hypothetical protein
MANLKVYVTTWDGYNHLIPGFAYLFNKYWSSNQEVIFLCYTKPSYSLPANFSMLSLGPPEKFDYEAPEWIHNRRGIDSKFYPTPKWTDSLRPLFEQLPDEPFILMQIDYFINRQVELDKIGLLKSFLGRKDVAKIDLTLDRTYHSHSLYAVHGEVQIIVSDQNAEYRSSLQAAIWTKDYFLRLLKPNRNPWGFELYGMLELKNDGKLILGIKQPHFGPVSYVNLFARGKLDRDEMNRIEKSVVEDMIELGLIQSNWNELM